MTKNYIAFFLITLFLFLLWFSREDIFNFFDNLRTPDQVLVELRLENQGLRQEIKNLNDKLNLKFQPYLSAQVCLRYPFNNNQALIINVGSKEGAKVGSPVLTAENHLLGKIVKVKADTSEVRTIFSTDWKSGVRIRQAGLPADQVDIEAVLTGGQSPKLEFIPADAEINIGDEILSASPDLPLSLFIGKISEIIFQSATSLRQAKLITDYEPNKLQKVFIISDYEGFD